MRPEQLLIASVVTQVIMSAVVAGVFLARAKRFERRLNEGFDAMEQRFSEMRSLASRIEQR